MTNFRLIPPAVQPFVSFQLPNDTTRILPNGTHITRIQAGSQPVVRLEWVFLGSDGFPPGTFSLLAKTLLAGTARSNSLEISESLDHLGAFHEVSSQLDRTTVTVYTLARQIPAVLDIFKDIFTTATFPDEEVRLQQKLTIQQIHLNQEKNSVVVNQLFRQSLFGQANRQGYILTESDVLALDRSVVESAYHATICHQPFHFFLSGSVSEVEFESLCVQLGGWVIDRPWSGLAEPFSGFTNRVEELHDPKPESLQASIRMGRPLITRKHPDFFPLLVANTALGGYFGSRLMKNIREEKGLTYGISSSLVPSAQYGYWLIGTDVKVELVDAAMQEIWHELEVLRKERIPVHELETVQNYLLGSFMGSLNTAFDIGDKYKMLYTQGLTRAYYDQYVENVLAVMPEDVQRVAQAYWQKEALTVAIVGGATR